MPIDLNCGHEEKVIFFSEGMPLIGLLAFPTSESRRKRPGAILVHGYANYKGEFGGFVDLAMELTQAGYVVLRFDFRGCGESGAPLGRMLCASEWPVDLISAISYLHSRPEVDEKRIGLVGQSLGGSTVAYVSAFDDRIACAVSMAAVSDGRRWLKELWIQKRSASAWNDFLAKVREDRLNRAISGRSLYTPIPEMLALDQEETAYWLEMRAQYPLFLYEAPWESIDSVIALRPIDVVHHTLCPIRFIHGRDDPLVSYEHSVALFERASQPKDLQLIEGADHALPIGPFKQQVKGLVLEWLTMCLGAACEQKR